MNTEPIQHFTQNARSPIFDGQATYVPPFDPGLRADRYVLVGGGSSDVTFDGGILNLTDRLARLHEITYGMVIPGTTKAMSYQSATKQVNKHFLKPDVCFKGGRVTMVLWQYLPGVRDQAPRQMSYFVIVPQDCVWTERQIIDRIAAQINNDQNRIADATVEEVPYPAGSSTTVSGAATTTVTPNVPQLVLTARYAGRYFESEGSGRFSEATMTAGNKMTLDGPFMDSVGAGFDPGDYAASKQYRGVAFCHYDTQPFAGGGLFRGGRAENNVLVLRRATVWVVGEVADADATTKLNTLLTVLRGAATPASKYNSRSTVINFV